MPRSSPKTTQILRGLLHPSWGPLLRVDIRSATGKLTNGLAVIDTGASISAIDKEAAAALHLPSHGVASWRAITLNTERPTSPLRRAQLCLGHDPRLWELDLVEVPGLKDAVEGYVAVVLLGWDFLQGCRLTLDGPSGTFTLELPRVRSSGRRRRLR